MPWEERVTPQFKADHAEICCRYIRLIIDLIANLSSSDDAVASELSDISARLEHIVDRCHLSDIELINAKRSLTN